ncbi:MAG TPA: O-antigen ligase family protein [Gemmatimonadaceae bacterium]|nr:O-antigen ligase family protein [Gemmatimonadaceae bacterium]
MGAPAAYGRGRRAAAAAAPAGGAAGGGTGGSLLLPGRSMLESARDPLRWALVALMILSIGRLHQYYSFLMPLRPGLLAVGFSSLYAILVPSSLSRARVLDTWQGKLVVALAAFTIVGAPFGLSIGQSAKFWMEYYSKVLAFWLLLVLGIRHAGDLSRFVWAYVIATAFQCYFSIFVFGIEEQFGSATMRLADDAMFMFDPNDLGVIMTVALPMALLNLQLGKWKGKVFSAIVAIAIAWTIALSGSRGGLIGLVVVALALLFMLKTVSVVKRLIFVGACAVALTLAAPAGYWEQMSTMLKMKDDYNMTSEDGRKAIWKRGMGYMFDYPVFGIGIDNFGRAEGTISDKAKNRDPDSGLLFAAAHNSFVQIGAEQGIPGLIMFISLCFGSGVSLLRLRKRLPPGWKSGDEEQRYLYASTMFLPISFFAFCVTGFFVSFAWQDLPYILVALGIGVHICVRQKLAAGAAGGAAPIQSGAPARGRGGRGAAAAATLRTLPR